MDVLNLSKNAPVLDLAKIAPALKTLRLRLTWKMHPLHGANLEKGFDLDIASFVLNSSGKIGGGQDVIFFNNRTYGANAIVLEQDERVGGEEICNYTLDKIPAGATSIDVYVSVFEYAQRGQHFGMITDGKVILENSETAEAIQEYSLADFSGQTALHVGTLTRSPNGWSFAAVGDAGVADLNSIAAAYLT